MRKVLKRGGWPAGQSRQTDLNGCTFPWSCLGLERHRPARGPPGHDMVHLSQFTASITQHAEVELVIFRRFAVKWTFFDRGDEKRDGIPVIQLVDEITL